MHARKGVKEFHNPRKAFERARLLLPDVQAELWPEATHAISGEFAEAVNAVRIATPLRLASP